MSTANVKATTVINQPINNIYDERKMTFIESIHSQSSIFNKNPNIPQFADDTLFQMLHNGSIDQKMSGTSYGALDPYEGSTTAGTRSNSSRQSTTFPYQSSYTSSESLVLQPKSLVDNSDPDSFVTPIFPNELFDGNGRQDGKSNNFVNFEPSDSKTDPNNQIASDLSFHPTDETDTMVARPRDDPKELSDKLKNRSARTRIKKPKKIKTSHNAIEKKYRLNINDKISRLRDIVPTLRVTQKKLAHQAINDIDLHQLDGLEPARKLNKGSILNKTIEYINHLQSKCDEYKLKNRFLEDTIERVCTAEESAAILKQAEGIQTLPLPSMYSTITNDNSNDNLSSFDDVKHERPEIIDSSNILLGDFANEKTLIKSEEVDNSRLLSTRFNSGFDLNGLSMRDPSFLLSNNTNNDRIFES
ncbi:hypothetical protein KAFR_0C05940 [Kazachstania africana CBS 2517]|uniref:BHLH domain-containing protein n=1 Tax=Kazachstania africana (strain ATCC 22294 / BCRC 22015 / CBS 2517 / CECT 1963 / NBRC 1671 / NRRL Y-8276) TaxID=1071382 RepID=H2AT85_KAZAF|nr:hypothetical protein KAFR_0C05940 [Kazachstania africana CBS 2517]CCF57585.1 hypothetical protein KAFR_0C05940 [Kazachstania africana CBS 2517]